VHDILEQSQVHGGEDKADDQPVEKSAALNQVAEDLCPAQPTRASLKGKGGVVTAETRT
jgi:hypothetical protein